MLPHLNTELELDLNLDLELITNTLKGCHRDSRRYDIAPCTFQKIKL